MNMKLDTILPILKAMAKTEPINQCESVGEGVYCPFCSFVAEERPRLEESDVPHEAGCPIVLAQHILRKLGIVLSVYRVSYETWAHWRTEPEWQSDTTYHLAFSPEEIRAYVTAEPHIKRRNIQVVLYRQIGSETKLWVSPLPTE